MGPRVRAEGGAGVEVSPLSWAAAGADAWGRRRGGGGRSGGRGWSGPGGGVPGRGAVVGSREGRGSERMGGVTGRPRWLKGWGPGGLGAWRAGAPGSPRGRTRRGPAGAVVAALGVGAGGPDVTLEIGDASPPASETRARQGGGRGRTATTAYCVRAPPASTRNGTDDPCVKCPRPAPRPRPAPAAFTHRRAPVPL